MENHFLWTKSKARLALRKTNREGFFNWLFLPGGPGLGSESLSDLMSCLELPGRMWALDLPGDGSNITENNTQSFSRWSEALCEATLALDNVVLVAHSTGGMYALATPALEKTLKGIVLMDSAPNAGWNAAFMEYVKEHHISEIEFFQEQYDQNPNNETLKRLTLSCAPYGFTKNGLQKGCSLLESLPYNIESVTWSAQYFDSLYAAKWIPKNIPALIFSGEEDVLTPLKLFSEKTEFQRDNILLRTISQAAHFPWIENPEGVVTVFKEFCENLVATFTK